jgi:hypothetical protein
MIDVATLPSCDERANAGLESLGRLLCHTLDQAEFLGHFHQVCERVSLHFPHYLASISFHSDLANAGLATDLFIQKAEDNQRHNLAFARRQ